MMRCDNPYEPSASTDLDSGDSAETDISSAHAAYNVVTDTVTGLNVRKSDNKFQAIFILLAMIVFAGVGIGIVATKPVWEIPWYGGAIMGGFAGMVIGFFASGISLMIYRAARHIKGKHE
jgi:ABC-type uncharacterized transport system permease subunit